MQNVLKRKIMQKYFVPFLLGYPLKLGNFSRYFHKILKLSIFPLEPKFFSFIKKIRFRAFWIFLYAYCISKIIRKTQFFFLQKSAKNLMIWGAQNVTGPQFLFFIFRANRYNETRKPQIVKNSN